MELIFAVDVGQEKESYGVECLPVADIINHSSGEYAVIGVRKREERRREFQIITIEEDLFLSLRLLCLVSHFLKITRSHAAAVTPIHPNLLLQSLYGLSDSDSCQSS